VGQQRLLDLAARGDVLDDNLYTPPGRFGGGGGSTTWLVGSAEDVARSVRRYEELGITHFVLSDTPYLREIRRQGDQLADVAKQGVPVDGAHGFKPSLTEENGLSLEPEPMPLGLAWGVILDVEIVWL